jgi:predicted lactoylglutathione lyase
MTYEPIVISLPIADRATSHAFYRDALALEAVGELGDDGIPEPLQFVVNDGVRIMLVPRGGFGWTVGAGEVAAAGHHECLLAVTAPNPAEVAALVERAVAAGGMLVTAPGEQPWGYVGAFTDPDGHMWQVTRAGGVLTR